MSIVTVEFRIDLVHDQGIEELDEAMVAARIAAGNIISLREEEALDGVLRIGTAEICDELTPAVHRLCFDAVSALVIDGSVFDYPYFSSTENAHLRSVGDMVALTGSDVPESTFPRRDLLCALYDCGGRWIAMLDQVGRGLEADRLRQFAASTHVALVAAGLA
ncbi:MAG TPA: hypothetical protein VFP84_24555 [Kofleriaceae bacterium]|nr:hypothetical protein [Kofleriaceae bacterium]